MTRLAPSAACLGLLALAASPAPQRADLPADPPADQAAEAAFQLGVRAELGRDQPADPSLAFHWYTIAARAGYAPAELNVGIMRDSGRGTAHDATKAAIWYARAAARGDRRAQYDLALLYDSGDGVPQSRRAARAWFRAAAASGLAAAAEHLSGALPGDDSISHAKTPPAPTPQAPASGAVIAPGLGGLIEFVWRAEAEPSGTHYLLQVASLDPAGVQEIHTQSLEVTATTLRLDQPAGAYAWRVYGIAARGERYSTTPWQRFRIASVQPSR